MRAAIAKRFSGDAAPERLRFFRIQSVSVTRRVLVSAPARGSARVTGRRQPPSSALPPTCIKTVTYFYGQVRYGNFYTNNLYIKFRTCAIEIRKQKGLNSELIIGAMIVRV